MGFWDAVASAGPHANNISRTTQVSRYQKGKTNLDFTEATDSEWQWHQLGHMQVRTLLQTDNNTSTTPLSILQARCPSWRPANSIKARRLDGQQTNPILSASDANLHEKQLSKIT